MYDSLNHFPAQGQKVKKKKKNYQNVFCIFSEKFFSYILGNGAFWAQKNRKIYSDKFFKFFLKKIIFQEMEFSGPKLLL